MNKQSKIKNSLVPSALIVTIWFSAACAQQRAKTSDTPQPQATNTPAVTPPSERLPQSDENEARLFREISKASDDEDYQRLAELLKPRPNLNLRINNYSLLVDMLSSDLKGSEMLLEAGADPNFPSEVRGCGQTETCMKPPIYYFFRGKYISSKDYEFKVIRLLLKYGADPNAEMLLVQAVDRNEPDLVEMLISFKADVNYNKEIGWVTPILVAKSPNMAELLIKNGADVNHVTGDGETALTFAIQDENPKMVRYFIKKGVDVNLKNKNGQTPLEQAQAVGNKEIINALKLAGAK